MVQGLKGAFSAHPRIVVGPTTKDWVQPTNKVLRTVSDFHHTLNFTNKALYSFLSWFGQRDVSILFDRTGVSSAEALNPRKSNPFVVRVHVVLSKFSCSPRSPRKSIIAAFTGPN